MSGSPSATPKSEKTMSSRLLTMKFMQRAAASAATKEPQTPAADEGKHTSKRPRLSTEAASPSTPQSDLEAISAALAAEEEKRREAIARQAAEAGESEWVLDIPAANYSPQPIVLTADSLDTEGSTPQGGRRAYGNFQRKKPVAPETRHSATQPEEDEDEEDDELEKQLAQHASDPEAVRAYIEMARQKALAKEARRKAAQAEAARVERKRLSNLTSISGSRQSSAPRMGGPSTKKKKRKF